MGVNDCDTSKVPRTLDREQGEQKMQHTEITSSTVAPVAPVASTKAPPKEPAPEPAPQASEDKKMQLDAANHVYEHAKGAWSWGKGLMVVSPILGLAEGITNRVVGVVGTNLDDIDKNLIKPQVDNLDNSVLNPAVNAIVGIVLGAASK